MSRTPVAFIAILAAAAPVAGVQDVHESDLHAFRVTTVVEGLEHPWSMAWLPNGDMLVTERPGRLRIVRNGVLDPNAIEGVPEVRARGQGGLLEVAVHPEYETNSTIYLSFSKPNTRGSEATTAVVRARFDGRRLADVEEIFEADAWSPGTGGPARSPSRTTPPRVS